MRIWTVHFSFKTAAAIAAAAAVVLFTAICTTILRSENKTVPQQNTADLCVLWLENKGLEVDPKSAVMTRVTIPAEFDEIYLEYNALQTENGFDLRHWAGMEADHYSYTLTNAPNNRDDIRANLLTYDGTVIGFDLYDLSEREYISKNR